MNLPKLKKNKKKNYEWFNIQSFKIILFLKLHNDLTAFISNTWCLNTKNHPNRIHFLQPGSKINIPFKIRVEKVGCIGFGDYRIHVSSFGVSNLAGLLRLSPD